MKLTLTSGKELELTLEELLELQRLISPAPVVNIVQPAPQPAIQYPWWPFPSITCKAGGS